MSRQRACAHAGWEKSHSMRVVCFRLGDGASGVNCVVMSHALKRSETVKHKTQEHTTTHNNNNNNNNNSNNRRLLFLVRHLCCGMDLSWQPVTGAAQRRQQRRQRSWWRHEQQSIAAALATVTHHSALRGQKTARAGWQCLAMLLVWLLLILG